LGLDAEEKQQGYDEDQEHSRDHAQDLPQVLQLQKEREEDEEQELHRNEQYTQQDQRQCQEQNQEQGHRVKQDPPKLQWPQMQADCEQNMLETHSMLCHTQLHQQQEHNQNQLERHEPRQQARQDDLKEVELPEYTGQLEDLAQEQSQPQQQQHAHGHRQSEQQQQQERHQGVNRQLAEQQQHQPGRREEPQSQEHAESLPQGWEPSWQEAAMAYDGVERDAHGHLQDGYLSASPGESVCVLGSAPDDGHGGNRYFRYLYGLVQGPPMRHGWFPTEVLDSMTPAVGLSSTMNYPIVQSRYCALVSPDATSLP